MSRIIPVFIPHAGCPHDCVFCNQKKIAGTLVPPEGREISAIIEKALGYSGENPEVAFYGGSFTAIERPLMLEYLSAAKRFIDEGRLSSIRLSTRPDSIDEEKLCILKEYGVKTIELGTQSMCEDVLKTSGRGHTAEDTENAVKLIRKHGFSLILQMMTHLPGSDDEKDIYTARKIASLAPDGVRVYPTVVVRDTALEALWRTGKYTPATPETAARLGGEILEIFEKSGIPVIRFGLNPTDDLSDGEALCGAYHPALGEMAMSELFLRRSKAEIERCGYHGGVLHISVNPKRVSVMSGQKKCNKKRLMSEYGFSDVHILKNEELGMSEVLVKHEFTE